MPSRRHTLCLVGIAIVGQAMGARPAEAEGADEAIGLTYTAPDGCATADEFLARLRARAPVRVEADGARTFEITISTTTGGAHGSLAVHTAAGTTVREVDGQTCDETMSALVLVAALAIVAGTEPPPVVAPPVVVAPVVVAPAPRGSVVRKTVPAPQRRIVVGSGLALYQGVAPAPVFGVPVFVAFGRDRGARLRVGFARSEQDQRIMPAGSTTFRWTTGRIDLSPVILTRGRFDVAPSIGIELGALDGQGAQVAMPTGGLRPWVAPDLAVRFRVQVDRCALELEGSLAVPVVRDRFFIAPGTTVHEVPRVTTGVGLTLAVGLW